MALEATDSESLVFLLEEIENIRQHVLERDQDIHRLDNEMAGMRQEMRTAAAGKARSGTVEAAPSDDTTQSPTTPEEEYKQEKKELLQRCDSMVYNDDEELGGREEYEMPEDVFTLMFFANFASASFVYGFFIFSLQMLVIGLIVYDMLEDDSPLDEDDGNPFNVPVEVELQVRVAQVAALLIAVIARDDVIDTFRIMTIGYKLEWRNRFPGCTLASFVVTNFLRLLEGTSVIFVAFCFIVQSDNVLDLFMNFAAIEFVSSLDNIAWELAAAGWTTQSMQELIERINNTTFYMTPDDVELLKRFPWAKQLLVVGMFAGLFGGWGKIYQIQNSGKLLAATSCGRIKVSFGEEVFSFADSPYFDGFRINTRYFPLDGSQQMHRSIAGSNRTIGVNFNESNPPDLIFSFFSGNYIASFEGSDLINDRPVYWERGIQDVTSGMFYYCDNEVAWVFTIPALAFAGALPSATTTRCEGYGWLIRSPENEEFSLDNVDLVGWKVWTGALIDMMDFRIECGECDTDIDCGVTRGVCNDDGVCECDDEYQGNFCSDLAPCTQIINYYPAGHLLFENSSGYRAYDRPLFERPTGETEFEVLLFSGRRWYDAYFSVADFQPYLEGVSTLSKQDFRSKFNDDFHVFWGNFLQDNVEYFSELTEVRSPTGPLVWTKLKETRSIGDYGYYGATEDVTQTFKCASVDCSVNRICGLNGTCHVVENITIQGGSTTLEWGGGECTCVGNVTGHYCEFGNRVNIDINGTVTGPMIDIDPYLAPCLGPFEDVSGCYLALYGYSFTDVAAIGGKEGTDFNGTVALGDIGNELNITVPEPTLAPTIDTEVIVPEVNDTEVNITDVLLPGVNDTNTTTGNGTVTTLNGTRVMRSRHLNVPADVEIVTDFNFRQ